ncbi:MAG: flippase-like domain-containing protein, partial [Clostridia bacterium]
PIGKYVFHQISYVILTTIVIFSTLFSAGSVSSGGVIVSTASWVGYILTAGLLAIIIFLSISKRLGAKLVAGILKIGKKMHLVKNYDKVYNSVMKTVDDFQSTMKFYAKSPKTFIKSFLYAFSSMILNYTLPFLIYCTFAGFNPSLWSDIFVKCVMIDLASGFIPLPGGTGMAELSFTALFASLFTEGRLFWALILWRILTYYGYIISGLLVMFYDYVIGNRRYNWQKKKWSLEKESEEFKSEQIEMFKKKIKKQQKNKN